MAQMKYALKFFLLLLLFFPLSSSVRAQSGNAPIIIRDTEIENILHQWLTPLAKAAGIAPKGVNLVLVQSPQLNAFVAGGANIFLYTGLIERTENPGELIGVMAHELGHIAGGHLIATREAYRRASYESILGAFIGIGAAIATGNGGAASAIISGSGNVAQRRFLSHSRVQESAADQAALRYMESAQYNPRGLASFFSKLESEELLPTHQQSEYMRTHPLTRDRVETAGNQAQKSPYYNASYPASWDENHARLKAKLIGFINPGRVPWVYDDRDQSVPARYARAIAAYRENQVQKALTEIDGLITLEPSNPYFQELKGQMLVDFGRVPEAISYYKTSVSMLPDARLIRIALAHALIESGQGQPALKEAVQHLERALQTEKRSSRAHRLLATAYGRLGDDNMAKLNLAEEALLQNRNEYAKNHAESVVKKFCSGQPDVDPSKGCYCPRRTCYK